MQVRVARNHKGSNGYLELFTLSRKIKTTNENFTVNSKTVLIIFPTNLQAGRFTIGDHKDLFVGVLASAQQIHCQFKPCYRIGMVWAYLQVGQVFYFHRPRIIAKYHNIERILGVAGGNKFAQSHGHFLCRGNPVFPVQNHGMADINHQYGTCLRFKICFPDLQIIFLHQKTLHTMVDLRIADAFGKINLLKRITKLKRLGFGVKFITHARFESSMISLL